MDAHDSTPNEPATDGPGSRWVNGRGGSLNPEQRALLARFGRERDQRTAAAPSHEPDSRLLEQGFADLDAEFNARRNTAADPQELLDELFETRRLVLLYEETLRQVLAAGGPAEDTPAALDRSH